MDEIEFRERLFADPFTKDQDIIEAAANKPELAQLRLEVQDFERQVNDTVELAMPASAELLEKLLAIPATDVSSDAAIASIGQAFGGDANTTGAIADTISGTNSGTNSGTTDSGGNVESIGSRNSAAKAKQARSPLFQYFALAASLVVALGLTYSFLGNGSSPSAADVAFGEEVFSHLRVDTDAINAISGGGQLQIQAVNTALDQAGVQLVGTDSLQANMIRFAEPCVIIPGNQSAHLVIQGSQGAVNVIVINNSPVASEFRITNERQAGRVIPLSDGNLVLVGDSEADLDQFSELFSENLQWSI